MTIIDREETGLGKTSAGHHDGIESTVKLLSDIQQKFCDHGLGHLSVNFVPNDYTDSVHADIVDPNGVIVLSIKVDRASGNVSEIY